MSEISPQKPTSIWKRPIQVNFGALIAALGKGVISGAFGMWNETATSGIDVLKALGIQGNKVEAMAWMLVQRSLLQGMSDLTSECKNELNTDIPDFNLLCEQLDLALERSELLLTPSFFIKPKDLPIVEQVKKPFSQWLQTYGLSQEQAQSLSDRLPRYFIFALNEQWRVHSADYALLQEALSGPFESANNRELAWMRYGAWLQRQVDEPMFAEIFGLRQVYVPLRAYYEIKESPQIDSATTIQTKRTLRHVMDLESAITDWLGRADKDDAIRVICGGPGCGKSSFGRMLAAHLTEAQTIPVLFIPLHFFDLSGDLVTSLSTFLRADLDNILPPNPLEKESAEQKVLLIFDGLDELSMQGKVGAQVAQEFVREVQKKLLSFNRNTARVFALLSGRELVIKTTKTEFRQEGQILYILPYFDPETAGKKYSYVGQRDLLQQDQRQVWWQTYGQLRGKGYTEMPRELNQGKLVEITAQPLLNYLVALSYDRAEIHFSTESNLNTIYNDLLKQVYKRDWAGYQHPTLGEIEQKDFIRILEEIAIACWHGNGRSTTVNTIEKRCTNSNLKRILEVFEGGAKEGVTRLLTAFYFRESGIQGNEATFEFTHKSFGEYLTARRIVIELKLMQQELERHREEPDIGWNEKECLKRWTILSGPTAMDHYLLTFLRDEVKLYPNEQVKQWQLTLSNLMGYMLRHGMPMEDLSSRPRFIDEIVQVRNASETLLAALSSCALVTQELSQIYWSSPQSFGDWLATIQGQRLGRENPVTFSCLNHLDLSQCILSYRDLNRVNLESSYLEKVNLNRTHLEGAYLEKANFTDANLERANLEGANLSGAHLERANLRRAHLERANLSGAHLGGARLEKANLSKANLEKACLNRASLVEASLDKANLEAAHLDGARLNSTSFISANLDKASLEGAHFEGANLNGARLNGARLVDALLDNASLVGASLDNANLNHASLMRASLARANLVRTSFDGACFDEARLDEACLIMAHLSEASFVRASLYRVSFDGANLNGVDLKRASLTQASLKNAILDNASFNAANLDNAHLDAASLSKIFWNNETCWTDITGIDTAKNVPEALKQQLNLEF